MHENIQKHSIAMKRGELIALHSCVTTVINKEIASPADTGLLMEALDELASQDKDTNKEFSVKLRDKFLRPIWHCCKIVLDNNLQRDHVHATDIMSGFSKVAKEIDKTIAMGRPPLEIIQ